ncbi:MAG: hypothetical protein F4X44_09930 [Gammaproteobacteria bacterium]|nr:hypothetical protein [Gammaproteobacteria bacterium]MYD80917.1 hypothetical protein [Gammaproteobacteria bacterium]
MAGNIVASPELKRITKNISEELEKEGWPPQDINWVIAIQIRNPLNSNAGQLHALSLCDLRHGIGLMKHLVEDYERRFDCTVNAVEELPFIVGGEA